MFRLRSLCAIGLGVLKDQLKAYFWTLLASSKGSEDAAKSIMSHISGPEGFKRALQQQMIKHYDLVELFAQDDRGS